MQGILRVHVIEAKHLMKKDISVLGKGKSDPYAVINVGAQEYRTKTIDNTVNPQWDFWCEVDIQLIHNQPNTIIKLQDNTNFQPHDFFYFKISIYNRAFLNSQLTRL